MLSFTREISWGEKPYRAPYDVAQTEKADLVLTRPELFPAAGAISLHRSAGQSASDRS
jgi:hypothetical protein